MIIVILFHAQDSEKQAMWLYKLQVMSKYLKSKKNICIKRLQALKLYVRGK